MTYLTTSEERAAAPTSGLLKPVLMVCLSGVAIVIAPLAFWLALLEVAAYVIGYDITNVVRFYVGATIVAILMVVWGFISASIWHAHER